jgi:hypothetical protein
MVPRSILTVRALPLLGSGKVDYGAVQTLVAKMMVEQPQPAN